jgi:iron complex transport system substrate-binding protein
VLIGRCAQSLLLAAALAGCSSAPALRAPGSQPTDTVVSLNPCTDAILAEVADRSQVLAISHYSLDPGSSSLPQEVARRYATTRGSVEEVLALNPDLVLGTSFTDPATANAYRRLGLRFERLGIARTVDESRAQIRQIAALVGHPDRGEALIARIDNALEQAAEAAGPAPIPAVVWQAGGIVPGEEALIVQLMQHAGFANHAARQGLGQADHLSLEQLMVDPPQVLFVVESVSRADTVNGEGSDRARFHPALARLDGTRREALDPRFLYCGGPTIVSAVGRFSEVRRQINRSGRTP